MAQCEPSIKCHPKILTKNIDTDTMATKNIAHKYVITEKNIYRYFDTISTTLAESSYSYNQKSEKYIFSQ